MTSAVILDVDGTLVDSNDAHAQAWVTAFNEAGMDVSSERVRRAIGMGGDKLMPHVSGITEDSRQGRRISERRKEIFLTEFLPHIRPFQRVRELVQRFLRDKFKVVIASSASTKELGSLLEVAGIADLLTSSTSSDDADRSKPDPDIVQAALMRSGASKEAAVMIGDTPYDVAAARLAGVAIVGVESGGWKRADLVGAVEVHPGVGELYASYDESILATLANGARHTA
jgi:phosphoglycolate phosphatase-like HAD superfamily hydrolase